MTTLGSRHHTEAARFVLSPWSLAGFECQTAQNHEDRRWFRCWPNACGHNLCCSITGSNISIFLSRVRHFQVTDCQYRTDCAVWLCCTVMCTDCCDWLLCNTIWKEVIASWYVASFSTANLATFAMLLTVEPRDYLPRILDEATCEHGHHVFFFLLKNWPVVFLVSH